MKEGSEVMPGSMDTCWVSLTRAARKEERSHKLGVEGHGVGAGRAENPRTKAGRSVGLRR